MEVTPKTKPEIYQDVKVNLAWYTSIVLLMVFFLCSYLLFGDVFTKWFESLRSELGKIIGTTVSVFVASPLIGWILIFIFEIHDIVYDRYLIQWRRNYSLDFLLPYLTRPISHRLDKSFFVKADEHLYDFMKPFYVFVGDGEGQYRIDANLRIRFYERIMKYWITQINEIILLSMFFVFVIFTFKHTVSFEKLTYSFLIIGILFLLNRFFIKLTREAVKQGTMDEIEHIHEKFKKQLDCEYRKVHEKFGMTYGEN